MGWFVYKKPFFFQERITQNERKFLLYKFRSIPNLKDKPDFYGKIIRSLNLDEILQLVNILKGDMNFIGPRPLLPEYLPHYSEKHKQRHRVKSGITGWAQVNGRNSLGWKENFDLDIYYVNNKSRRLDFSILYKTVLSFFKQKTNQHQIRSKFKGYE